MSAGVAVRGASATDVAAVLALWVDADAAVSATDDASSVAGLIAHQASRLFLAEADGILVGTVIATWDGWRGGIYRLAVLPGWRRRGVARFLVRRCEEHLRALGCRRVGALVLHQEDQAVGFWQAMGYERDGRIVRYVADL